MIFIAAPQNAGFKKLVSHTQVNACTGIHGAAGNLPGDMGKSALVLRRGDGNRNAPLPFRADTELTLRRGKDRRGGNQLG